MSFQIIVDIQAERKQIVNRINDVASHGCIHVYSYLWNNISLFIVCDYK